MLGLGLYTAAPMVAFVIELVYGVLCWYVYKGGRGLLALVTLGNLANLSFFSPAVPGPEQYMAGRPMLAVTVIFAQIVVTWSSSASSVDRPQRQRSSVLDENPIAGDRGLAQVALSATV